MAREKIIKLGQMITDRIGVKVSENDPEYWGLAEVLTDEMADVCLAMKVRKPMTLEQIAKKAKMDEKRVEVLLQEMAVIGMIEYNWENEDRHKQYILPMFVPGAAEFFMMNEKQVEEHPRLADFFENMSRLPLEKVTKMVPPGGAGIGMHVIPVEKAIPAKGESVSVEHISHWLNKYKDKYAVGACSCRRQQRVRGEGTGEIEGNLCIGVGDMADYLVETGKGEYVSLDKVMDILERAERHGFVHQITNIDGEDKIFAICNCAPGVCNAIRTSQLFNTPNMSASAYRAHVEKEKCVACGKCVEVCPVGAAKLGQKLCTKSGPVIYPKIDLPDNNKWGKEQWSPNYRDEAKINCYDTGTAPCKTACPAHLAVQGYIKMASEGRYMDALKLIKQDNPFPAVCGAICNRRCEDACTRGKIDQALAIDEIKKFIAEQELDLDKRYIPLCENHEGKFFSQKMAVIGAGPSGLSCAYYLREKGYPVTIFEKNELPGGMLQYGIPNYRLEKDVIAAEIDVLRQMGVEFKCNVEIGKDLTINELRNQGYEAFYLAIGACGARNLGVDNEDANGVESGIEFLKNINTKLESKLDGDTVVIGGGNVAIDVARSARRISDNKVIMVSLESREEMPAHNEEIDEALEENIEIINSYGVKEIKVENNHVQSIVLKKCISIKDESGRFSPAYDENDVMEVKCSNIIKAIGQSIIWNDLLKDENVDLNKNGTVIADPVTLQTSVKDIFAGGDVLTGPRFAIDAIAMGKEAAVSMHRFVHKGHSLTLARDLRHFIEFDKDDIVIESFDNAPRQIPGKKIGDATKTFADLRSTFTSEQVQIEAKRCLGCGASIVDTNKCIGCGLCTTKCEFDAIHLSRDIPAASKMYKAEDKLKAILPYAAKRAIKIKFKGDKK